MIDDEHRQRGAKANFYIRKNNFNLKISGKVLQLLVEFSSVLCIGVVCVADVRLVGDVTNLFALFR